MEKVTRIVSPGLLNEIRLKRCVICARRAEPHHIVSKGAGGDDSEDNLMPLCRCHHSELHQIGRSRFINKYPDFKLWLIEHNRWDVLSKIDRNLERWY